MRAGVEWAPRALFCTRSTCAGAACSVLLLTDWTGWLLWLLLLLALALLMLFMSPAPAAVRLLLLLLLLAKAKGVPHQPALLQGMAPGEPGQNKKSAQAMANMYIHI